jgi:CspA family cold shock protein
MNGLLIRFNADASFGVIRPDDGGENVHAHASEIDRSYPDGLREGDQVTFDVEPDADRQGRPEAVNIQRLSSRDVTSGSRP